MMLSNCYVFCSLLKEQKKNGEFGCAKSTNSHRDHVSNEVLHTAMSDAGSLRI
jgi:hypothetical protein